MEPLIRSGRRFFGGIGEGSSSPGRRFFGGIGEASSSQRRGDSSVAEGRAAAKQRCSGRGTERADGSAAAEQRCSGASVAEGRAAAEQRCSGASEEEGHAAAEQPGGRGEGAASWME